MENQEQHLKDLSEIKSLMQKSSRFLSLSGLSGVCAGFIAIAGAAFAFFYLNYDLRYFNPFEYFTKIYYSEFYSSTFILIIDALIVLVLALSTGIFFTIRRAKRNKQSIWDNTTKRFLVNLILPLGAGGIFCLILLYHKIIFLLAPCTLIFYGLALLNASKFTLDDIKYLGISEIILGLAASFFIGYGLIFWAIGFGILHIVYGAVMYYKYEK